MWLICAFLSAVFLGIYDALKKKALSNNAVIPVLFLNTLFSSIILLPTIVASDAAWPTPHAFLLILIKAFIVLASWMLGYFGIKHLPLTIVGPINATRPVMVLLGAIIVFGEKLNPWQWAGVILAITSFLLLGRSGKKEGIDFKHNKHIYMIVGAAALGAISGLYDKYLMAPVAEGGAQLNPVMVQAWYNIFQAVIMFIILCILRVPKHKQTTPFRWDYAIIGISVFLTAADFLYFYALSLPAAMISIVSMIRRGSVIVSFLCGATFFHERNLKAKTLDLVLVILGMICLYIGSK